MSCNFDQPEILQVSAAHPVSAMGPKSRLDGDAIALPTEDARELDRRFDVLDAEMAPQSELARQLVIRVALLTVRLDRSAEREAKAIAHRMRRARDEFDDARLAEVEHLSSWIANEPATHARRLRRSPEGLDLLIGKMEALGSSLVRPQGCRWDLVHCDQLLNLMGLRLSDLPIHRARVLTEAMEGRFQHLDEADGAGLDAQRRKEWALCELVKLIDAEIAKLKDLLSKFDREAIEFDRADAVARAMFDHSNEASQARKYESATERGLYRALREFRELQSETAIKTQVAADLPAIPALPSPEELGSFLPDPSANGDEMADVDPTAIEAGQSRPEGAPMAVNQPARRPSRPIPSPSKSS